MAADTRVDAARFPQSGWPGTGGGATALGQHRLRRGSLNEDSGPFLRSRPSHGLLAREQALDGFSQPVGNLNGHRYANGALPPGGRAPLDS
jgi:hypothetical protein